jgi:hypothetical protein
MSPTTSLFHVQLLDTTGNPAQSFDLHAADVTDAIANAGLSLRIPHLMDTAAAVLITGPGIEGHEAYDAELKAIKLTR